MNIKEEKELKVACIIMILLAFLLIFVISIKIISLISINNEVKGEIDGLLKKDFCDEKGYKYYRNYCWKPLFDNYGSYRFPILESQDGLYLGAKEDVNAGQVPNGW